MESKYSRKRRAVKSKSEAEDLILEVINNDFPSIDVEKLLGYQATENDGSIVGQIAERETNIVYNFTFSKDNPKVVMQRFI
jgi:hypothetical protein